MSSPTAQMLMRVDVCDPDTRRKLGRIEVAPADRPTRARLVSSEQGQTSATGGLFLEWESAIDDAGRLRRCIVCGCRELYASRAFPQVTGFVVVLAFAGAAVGISGLANQYPILYAVLIFVLIIDVASLIFAKKRLVCYRCRSMYSHMDIARHHQRWDRAIAEKYPSTLETTGAHAPSPPGETPTGDEFD